MASVKIIAVLVFLYALLSQRYMFIIWAVVLWEIGGGFKGLTALWFSDFGKGNHDS